MQHISISHHDLELTLEGPRGKERLSILGTYPGGSVSKSLFAQLGLMHLVAPYLPESVSADFPLSKHVRKLISAMYRSEHEKPPMFNIPRGNETFHVPKIGSHRAVVAYSAGKDSLWNMWWAQEKYGAENVLAVHISGLNRAQSSQERIFAHRQCETLKFKHFTTVDLRNSSRNRGYRVMRSRDIFLASLMVPHALSFGASHIITEGFAETHDTEPFSGQAKNVLLFNETLQKLGLPVAVVWRNKAEMDVMRDLFLHRPSWVPHVCNCFTVPCYMQNLRRYWKRAAPTLELYDSQCGSCVKCRITNLGRILYDPKSKVTTPDARIFLENTVEWFKKNKEKLHDMIAGSFKRDLLRACSAYDVHPPSVIQRG